MLFEAYINIYTEYTVQNETTNDEYNPAGPKVSISLKPRDFNLLLSATQVQNRAVIKKLGSSS